MRQQYAATGIGTHAEHMVRPFSHLEMAWFHLLDFALFNHPETMAKSLDWYNNTAYSKARAIAQRQGYEGIRWMKMTDPWAGEAPSSVVRCSSGNSHIIST